MADVWIRKRGSFDDDRRADREFWRAVTPDARIAAVEPSPASGKPMVVSRLR